MADDRLPRCRSELIARMSSGGVMPRSLAISFSACQMHPQGLRWYYGSNGGAFAHLDLVRRRFRRLIGWTQPWTQWATYGAPLNLTGTNKGHRFVAEFHRETHSRALERTKRLQDQSLSTIGIENA